MKRSISKYSRDLLSLSSVANMTSENLQEFFRVGVSQFSHYEAARHNTVMVLGLHHLLDFPSRSRSASRIGIADLSFSKTYHDWWNHDYILVVHPDECHS
ncbi:hypothetical protein Pfo_003562 [Paulownia fortunei]|nr:hypothetical protein Pfo_003562 [Paulownia fortunei]